MKKHTVTIERLKSGIYRLRWRLPDGTRPARSLGKCSRMIAKEEKRKLEDALNNGNTLIPVGHPTISGLILTMMETWVPGHSPGYWTGMRSALELLMSICGDRLDLISPLAADSFKSSLIQSGRKHSTIKEILQKVKTAFNQAVRWRMLSENVFDEISSITVPINKVTTWTPQEIELFLGKLTRRLDRCIVYLALDAGLRAKEIANLNILNDYINMTGAVYVVNRETEDTIIKNKREREGYIMKDHQDEMSELQQTCIDAAMKYPFYQRDNQKLSRRMYDLCHKHSTNKTLQDLRHTCATRLAMTASSREVQEYIGDSSIVVVEKHYFGKTRAERLRDLQERANKEFNILNDRPVKEG